VDRDFSVGVTFMRRSHAGAGPLVALGPAVAQFVQPARRAQRAISDKGGGRYDMREKAFAVIAVIRDHACDLESLITAVYGGAAGTLSPINPEIVLPPAGMNGLFGRAADRPEGKNRRLSCVFALVPGWTPGSGDSPAVYRLDNPFAEHSFPEDILPTDHEVRVAADEDFLRVRWVDMQ
jgi:hypothetical protein